MYPALLEVKRCTSPLLLEFVVDRDQVLPCLGQGTTLDVDRRGGDRRRSHHRRSRGRGQGDGVRGPSRSRSHGRRTRGNRDARLDRRHGRYRSRLDASTASGRGARGGHSPGSRGDAPPWPACLIRAGEIADGTHPVIERFERRNHPGQSTSLFLHGRSSCAIKVDRPRMLWMTHSLASKSSC